MCGYSLEVNATSDMDYFLASHQAELMLDVAYSNLLSFIPGTAHGDTKINDPDERKKTSMANNQAISNWSNFTAFDVLLTAGRISLMVYDIADEK